MGSRSLNVLQVGRAAPFQVGSSSRFAVLDKHVETFHFKVAIRSSSPVKWVLGIDLLDYEG